MLVDAVCGWPWGPSGAIVGSHILEGHACELGAADADRSIVGCVSRGWRLSVVGGGVIPKPEKRNTVVRLDVAS